MNKQQYIQQLKSKVKELEVTKLCLEGAIRTLANEIIRTNDELAIVEGSKPSSKRQKRKWLIYRSTKRNSLLNANVLDKTANKKSDTSQRRL